MKRPTPMPTPIPTRVVEDGGSPIENVEIDVGVAVVRRQG